MLKFFSAFASYLSRLFFCLLRVFFNSTLTAFLASVWSQKASGGLVGGVIFLVFFAVLVLGIFLLMKFPRRNFARVFSYEGVEIHGGQKFGWEKLHFLNYKKVNAQINGYNLAASATRAANIAGVEKVTVEMVFESGKAVVPPLTQNQP